MGTLMHRSVLHVARRLFSARHAPNVSLVANRTLTTNGDGTGSTNGAAQRDSNRKAADGFFDEDNTLDLSPLEVARMRVTYGLVKEHVEAVEKGLGGIDANANPLIDPRSFDIRTLPDIPGQVLKQFRKQVPAEAAGEGRSVSTYNLWESIQSGETHELLEESTQQKDEEWWRAVDERTMGREQYGRLQRQSVTRKAQMGPHAAGGGWQRKRAQTRTHKRRKGECVLTDGRGRVMVDFRAVETLKGYLSDRLKLVGRRRSGLSAKAQRKVTKAVKTARTMALLNPEPIPRLTVEEMIEMDRQLP
ncbi:unnamed protein product [Agarophyton chilense]